MPSTDSSTDITDRRGPGQPPPHRWWSHAVVYQVYIRSFADGNGDGNGDIAGLRSRLGYLRDLGIDAIWVNPWYPSPRHDGGYDVADYKNIDPSLGTLEEAEALVTAAHAMGIRVLADLVPNHTSSEHPWFREALAAAPAAPARRRYHFLPGRGDGSQPPNNWRSLFGGPAWERTQDGEWYLHLFDATQPDLNWGNPEVRAEFDEVLRFWLDRGIDGFRVDVAPALVKHPGYPDAAGSHRLEWRPGHPFWDRDEIHGIFRQWRRVLEEYGGDRIMVAEAPVVAERLPLYVRPGEHHQAFNFPFLETSWDAASLRRVISESVSAAAAVGSLPTWVLSNHDVVRHATRFGLPAGVEAKQWLAGGPHDLLDAGRGLRRARAAALLMLALPGSVYLYQGEELGLPEVWDLPDEMLNDPIWRRSGGTERGRDGCRVPLPWTAEGPSFGFGPGAAWLPQPPAFGRVAVDRQLADPGSTLELHRRAIRFRRRLAGEDAELDLLDLGDEVVGYRRGNGLMCVVNMAPEPLDLPAGEVVLSSVPVEGGTLDPDAAAWLRPA